MPREPETRSTHVGLVLRPPDLDDYARMPLSNVFPLDGLPPALAEAFAQATVIDLLSVVIEAADGESPSSERALERLLALPEEDVVKRLQSARINREAEAEVRASGLTLAEVAGYASEHAHPHEHAPRKHRAAQQPKPGAKKRVVAGKKPVPGKKPIPRKRPVAGKKPKTPRKQSRRGSATR